MRENVYSVTISGLTTSILGKILPILGVHYHDSAKLEQMLCELRNGEVIGSRQFDQAAGWQLPYQLRYGERLVASRLTLTEFVCPDNGLYFESQHLEFELGLETNDKILTLRLLGRSGRKGLTVDFVETLCKALEIEDTFDPTLEHYDTNLLLTVDPELPVKTLAKFDKVIVGIEFI